MKSFPNILTSMRLVLALFMFVALAAASGAVPGLSDHLEPQVQFGLQRWAVYAFVVAAVTDSSTLVCAQARRCQRLGRDPRPDRRQGAGSRGRAWSDGAGRPADGAPPAGLILFASSRSARCVKWAPAAVSLPVTLLAKWKPHCNSWLWLWSWWLRFGGAFPFLAADASRRRSLHLWLPMRSFVRNPRHPDHGRPVLGADSARR